METFGNEVKVQQGEDWNLDLLLSANQVEYIPYIVSSERFRDDRKAFFVITVASTKFEKNLRYVCSFWCSLSEMSGEPKPIVQGLVNIPTFYGTTPVWYKEVATIDDLPSIPPEPTETKDKRYLYQYICEDEDVDPETGHKPYHYFYYNYIENDDGEYNRKIVHDTYETKEIAPGETEKVLVPAYECRIRFNFLSEVTADWTGQNYMYQITLVSGQGLKERLEAILDEHGGFDAFPDFPEYDEEEPEKSLAAQYKYVKIQWPDELQPDVDDTSPLGTIETPEVILQPTRLQVFNNLRQLI